MEQKTPFEAGRAWCREHLGSEIVAPGHPLILAVMVLERFPGMSNAIYRARVEDIRTAAEVDPFIPATPKMVRQALEVLEVGLSLGAETAIARAEEKWLGLYQTRQIAEGHLYSGGKFQAKRVEVKFRERLALWQRSEQAANTAAV